MTKPYRNVLLIAALAALAIPVTAGGAILGRGAGDPPGTPNNPLVAPPLDPGAVQAAKEHGHLNEARSPGAAYPKDLAISQRPCKLVTPEQAAGILGAPILAPAEAPLGPTCVYRTRSPQAFATVSVQSLDADQLKTLIRGVDAVSVGGREGHCGRSDPTNLYVPLSGERVLTVGGACDVARAFAAKALARLG
jgi:hypothetical protein